MARTMNYKKPKDTKKTLKRLLGYLGVHKIAVAIVAILVTVSSVASILGTYLLKPVVNRYILPGDVEGLARMLFFMGVMYAVGVLATYGYGQIMARTGQQVVSEIREDLFRHTQGLPLSYFDGHTHGELMSRFTNDVDTISEALNNSFTTLIQSFFTIAGTIICIILLNFKLSLIVLVFMLLMFFFIKYSGVRGKRYFNSQQKYLGEVNGFIEEMVDGQKVEKVFNHEEVDFKEFSKRNENLRKASTSAFQYSGMLIPTIVSLSYVNYAVSACVGGLFVIQGMMDLGSLASYLVYVRQSAGQSVYNAGQFPAGSIVRSREDFRYDGRRTGVGRGNCHTVQSPGKRRWLFGGMQREKWKMGMERYGGWDSGPALWRCTLS